MQPPRITLAVLAYRQQNVIDAALASAFAQECEPIEILLSDDASPDATFDTMQRLARAYRGPHRVVTRRNPSNLGIGEHFNALMRAATGQLVVLMAGDDISLPHRVAAIARAWDASGGSLDLIASHVVDMTFEGQDRGVIRVDDLSQWRGPPDWARRRPYIVGAAHALTRRLHERFGPLGTGVAHEDQVNLLRAVCAGGACTIDEPLVRYRRGGVSGGMQDFSAEFFLAWTRRQNQKSLALHRQWLSDAAAAGCEPLVEIATSKEHRREQFMHALLESPTASGRLQAALRFGDVDAGWRWRKWLYFAMPALAARVRAWQAASRRRRREDKSG